MSKACTATPWLAILGYMITYSALFIRVKHFELNLIFALIGINKVLLFPATLFQQLYALSFLAVVATYQKSAGIQPR